MPNFSFLLPTRKRPDLVYRFIQSVLETTSCTDDIEIILAIDDDDLNSGNITHDGLNIKKVILPRGATMGSLNRTCFDASSGRYVMLINDDVILRTKNWDLTVYNVFSSYKDDIGMVHVNDLLFHEKLCTFPILSRKACLEIGICPSEYQRYRIDDHIYDTYCLLASLGHKRITYLADVIFEHDNHTTDQGTQSGQVFKSKDNKIYVPNQEIIELDAPVYDEKLEERKANAVKLALMIDQDAYVRKESIYISSLQEVSDSMSFRRPEYVRQIPLSSNKFPQESAKVTVGIVTANMQNKHTIECLSRIKKYTRNCDLVVLDNNNCNDFNHPKEMNKILDMATTDFVVLMDDDVFVEEGWLDGLLKCVDAKTGVTMPMHKDKTGALSYSGVYLMGDDYGTHTHHIDVPDKPRVCQTLCSAILLIDMGKCGAIRFNERFKKYFHDIEYALQIWEAGYKVICTSDVCVTHLGGGTLRQGSNASTLTWNMDMPVFTSEWIHTGRLTRLKENVWPDYPFLHLLTEIPKRIRAVFKDTNSWEISDFKKEVENLLEISQPFTLFRNLMVNQLVEYLWYCHLRQDFLKADFCEKIFKQLKNKPVIASGYTPCLIDSYKGYNLVSMDRIYAVPLSYGPINMTVEQNRQAPGIISAENIQEAHDRINLAPHGSTLPISSLAVPNTDVPVTPVLVQEGYKGHNIVLYGNRYFALPQADGSFDGNLIDTNVHKRWLMATTVQEARDAVDNVFKLILKNRGKKTINKFINIIASGIRNHRPKKFGHREKPNNYMESSEDNDAYNSEPEHKPISVHPLQVEDYKGFNIIFFSTKYFGLRQDKGSFNMEAVRSGKYKQLFIGDTVEEVKREIDYASGEKLKKKQKALFLYRGKESKTKNFHKEFDEYDLTLLMLKRSQNNFPGFRKISYLNKAEKRADDFDVQDIYPDLKIQLEQENFDLVIIPYGKGMNWGNTKLETFTSAFSNRLLAVFPDSRMRFYKEEDIRRIIYNKAYLNSIFNFVPNLKGQKILDVGCSDGLVCDLLLSEDPKAIVGIDVLETVGCGYLHEKISYHKMDAVHLDFNNASFDLCLSIATLEHISEPVKALHEMKRVTQKGGILYVQAGPLYHSPYGHHMFGYFDDYPWIHLRLSREEIADYCIRNGIDERIRSDRGIDVQEYVYGMLNKNHINKKSFEEYGLREFMNRKDVNVLHFSQSHEGEDLLTSEILDELRHFGRDTLTSHGFELIARME